MEIKICLKNIKDIMLAQAASAARKTLRYLSDRDLDDMGLSRSTFVDGVVESVKADIEANVKDQPISKNKNVLLTQITWCSIIH